MRSTHESSNVLLDVSAELDPLHVSRVDTSEVLRVNGALDVASTRDDFSRVTAPEVGRGIEKTPDELIRLPEQYSLQLQILRDGNCLEKRDGTEGVTIGDVWYPVPTEDAIREALRDSHHFWEKIAQGFTALRIYSLDLERLVNAYGTELKQHAQAKTLRGWNDESLELDSKEPVWVRDDCREADRDGSIIIGPCAFDANSHRGTPKRELGAGFRVGLVEPFAEIPLKDRGQEIGGRRPIEAGLMPVEYLERFMHKKAGPHAHERGWIYQTWLMHALSHLKETNGQVIDDQTLTFLIDSYLSSSGVVPDACFSRGDRQAGLSRGAPQNRVPRCGARAEVGVL